MNFNSLLPIILNIYKVKSDSNESNEYSEDNEKSSLLGSLAVEASRNEDHKTEDDTKNYKIPPNYHANDLFSSELNEFENGSDDEPNDPLPANPSFMASELRDWQAEEAEFNKNADNLQKKNLASNPNKPVDESS